MKKFRLMLAAFAAVATYGAVSACTNFIITLKNSICGYDDVLAYAMPDHRIVVLTGLLFHEQKSDEIIRLAIGCAERMLSLSKIDGRVEIETSPAISPAG